MSITYEPQHVKETTSVTAQTQGEHRRIPSVESITSLSDVAERLDGIVMAQTQCLRTLANLCIDNDANRRHLLLHDTPLFILKLIQDVLNTTPSNSSHFDEKTLLLLKTAVGALLNLQLDHAESRRWLLKLPKPRRHHCPHEHHGHYIQLEGEPQPQSCEVDDNIDRGSPFELQETETLKILISVATEPRIYTPWEALHSILGPRAEEFESEKMFEDDGRTRSNSQDSMFPTQNNWSSVVLGAEVASWASRVAEDLLAFEAEQMQAKETHSPDGEASILPSPVKSALAVRKSTWECLLLPLMAFVWRSRTDLSAEPPDGDIPDDASPFVDADMALLCLCGSLLEGCAHIGKGQDPAAKGFKKNGMGHLAQLLDFVQHGASPFGVNTSPPEARLERYGLEQEDLSSLGREVARTKANVVKAIVAIAGEDVNMPVLFGDHGESPFLDRMKEWLRADRYQREDLVSCALLSIANLGRNDDNCVALATSSMGLIELLVDLLHSKGSLLLSHATLGLLKNLSIPPSNKPLIGATPTFFDVLPLFMLEDCDHAQPIQFSAVGIAKHLAFSSAGGVEGNAVAICLGPTFGILLDLIGRTKDVPTRLEGTRVMVNLIRTLWAPVASEAAKEKLRDRRVINALADMIRRSAKYPVLINESLVGFMLLIRSPSAGVKSELTSVISNALLGNVIEASQSPQSTSAAEISSTEFSESRSPVDCATQMRAPPQRSSTIDSTTSAYSAATATNSPYTAADVLYDMLSRPRDATRAPVQFCENACTLLTTLAVLRPRGDEAVQSLCIKMLPSLRALKTREARQSIVQSVNQALDACERAAF